MAQSPSEQNRMAPWAMLEPGVRLGGQGWRGQAGSKGAACSSDRPLLVRSWNRREAERLGPAQRGEGWREFREVLKGTAPDLS